VDPSQLDMFPGLDTRVVPITLAARILARRYRMTPRLAALVAQHAGIGGGDA